MKNTFFSPLIFLLVKWSGIAVTDGRGKVGGTVFSKSKAGATARNKVTPINRRTAAQSQIRAIFTSFSQLFRTLTDSQITAWNAAASSGFTTTNIFGDTIHKSGSMLYVALNTNLTITGNASISDPPSSSDSPSPLLVLDPVSDVSSTNIFLNADFGSGVDVVPADNALLVYATPKLSNGVTFVKSQLRVLGSLPASTDTGSTNMWGVYVAKYGAPAVGDNIVFAVQCVNTVSGIAGTPIQTRVTITA